MATHKLPTQVYPWSTVKSSEWVGHGSSIGGSFSVNKSTWTQHYLVYPEDLIKFVQDMIGWATKSTVFANKINRRLPFRHPDIPYLYCSGISSVEGIASTGQRLGQQGILCSGWRVLKVGVQFDDPAYNIKANGDFDESERFVIPDFDPSTEFIQRDLSTFIWPAATPNLGLTPVLGSKGATISVSKQRRTYIWVQVPDDGLFTAGGFDKFGATAENIERCVGKVNDGDFLGCAAGTLLLESWKPEPIVMPVPPLQLGKGPTDVPRAWNVRLTFLFFDPQPRGDDTIRGHNLVPCPKDNKWWRPYVKLAGDVSAGWRYQETNFDLIFEMN